MVWEGPAAHSDKSEPSDESVDLKPLENFLGQMDPYMMTRAQ